ncbi:MAG: PD-(D/E)XK nuclease family protein [Pseudomonadota bacterium]|nr:PD-(D/E)XK nuclease family protein [Pseudomonadota bacterium]
MLTHRTIHLENHYKNVISLDELTMYKNNYTLLTLSQNKANYYLNLLIKNKLKHNPTICEIPKVLPIYAWLKKLYEDLLGRKIIVSKQHKQLSLIYILKNHLKQVDCHEIIALSHKLIKTFDEIIKWEIKFSDIKDILLGPDIKLSRIYNEYRDQLSQQNMTDDNHFLQELLNFKKELYVSLTDKLILDLPLVEEITPLTFKIINFLKDPHDISLLSIQKFEENITLLKNENNYEYNFQETKKWISSKNTNKDKVAIFVPNLSNNIFRVKRALNNAFIEHTNSNLDHVISFNNNQSIISYPSIDAIGHITQLISPQVQLNDIIACFESPFLFKSMGLKKIKLAKLLKKERENYDVFMTKVTISDILLYIFNSEQDEVVRQIEKFLTKLKSIPDQVIFHEYIENLSELLCISGWYNSDSINSHEIEKTYEIMQQLIGYKEFKQPIQVSEANIIFKNLLTNYKFQKSNNDCKIQVYDYKEAPGRSCKLAWYSNFDQALNTTKKAQGLLPKAIYKKYNLYNTDHQEIENKHIANIKNMVMSQEEVVISYNNDGAKDINNINPVELFFKENNILAKKFLEISQCEHKQKLNSNTIRKNVEEHVTLTGSEKKIGTYHIKEHQNCHFRGFAKFRLGLKDISDANLGLNPRDKGIIVHEILQNYFTKFKAQPQQELTDEQQNFLQNKIKSTVKKYLQNKPRSGNSNYIKSEINIISKMLKEFFVLESERPKFSIASIEHKHNINVSDITIKCVIDRIDKINDNEYILLDYKTGVASPAAWFGERISDPQMPIYSLNYKNKLAAISFIKINHIKVCYSGLTQESHYFNGLQTKYQNYFSDWQNLENYWQTQISEMIRSYSNGSTILNPAVKSICYSCEYQRLCRIWELKNQE